MTSRHWSLVSFILPNEAEVDEERCCTKPWSENLVCEFVVAQGEHGFTLLGHLVRRQLQKLSQKAVQNKLLFWAQSWGSAGYTVDGLIQAPLQLR